MDGGNFYEDCQKMFMVPEMEKIIKILDNLTPLCSCKPSSIYTMCLVSLAIFILNWVFLCTGRHYGVTLRKVDFGRYINAL